MAYVVGNPSSKAELRRRLAAGETPEVFNPSGMFPPTENGIEIVEGPHSLKPHRWYAEVQVRDGLVVKVLR